MLRVLPGRSDSPEERITAVRCVDTDARIGQSGRMPSNDPAPTAVTAYRPSTRRLVAVLLAFAVSIAIAAVGVNVDGVVRIVLVTAAGIGAVVVTIFGARWSNEYETYRRVKTGWTPPPPQRR